MANKTIPQYTAAATIDGTNDLLLEYQASSGVYKSINRSTFLGVTGTPADISTTQTFTNKVLDNTNTITVKDTLFTLQDDGDVTKQVRFQLSGITTGNTRTLTVPNASVTLASLTGTETLTNKTITSPTITGGTIDNTTITVDSISGHTTPTIVTVGGVQMNNGVIGTSNAVVTASVADTAITPAKLQAGTGAGWSTASWTPTLTNASVGNGTMTAKYIQTGKMVTARFALVLGSTSSVTGEFTATLPVTAATYAGSSGLNPVGLAQFYDTSASALYGGVTLYNTTTTVIVRAVKTDATYGTFVALSATVPFGAAFAVGDEVEFTITYEAA